MTGILYVLIDRAEYATAKSTASRTVGAKWLGLCTTQGGDD
jgi:hypothetical protein